MTVSSTVLAGLQSAIEDNITAVLPTAFAVMATFMGINIVISLIRRAANA